MAVPREIEQAASESLTTSEYSDLVDRHLGINYSYFGAIDKTLAGFVVLDDTGDDYVLWDGRDSKQLFFQEHEERLVYLTFDSLADRAAAAEAIARAEKEGEDVDRREIERAFHTTTSRGTRRVSTTALLERYQWLVWLLAQPLRNNGVPTQSTEDLVRSGVGGFRRAWPRREEHDAALEAELPDLAADPHLAIYWLLHTTMIGDDAARERVLAAIGTPVNELVAAFVERVGGLGVAGDLPVVPDFRMRRALVLSLGAFENSDLPPAVLRAIETSPATNSLLHARLVIGGLEEGMLTAGEIAATLNRVDHDSPGTLLLRAVIAQRVGGPTAQLADALTRALPTCGEPWWYQLEALWLVQDAITDVPAFVAAADLLVANDRFHKRAVSLALRAAKAAGILTSTLEAELVVADRALAPYTAIAEDPKKLAEITAELDDETAHAVAWRVLQRAELNKPHAAVAAWALPIVLAGGDARRTSIIGPALAGLDQRTQGKVLDEAKRTLEAAADPATHPMLEVLFTLLDGPEPPAEDFLAGMNVEKGKERALQILAPYFHLPAIFERLMERAERPLGKTFVDPLWNKLFSPFQKDTYVAKRLDATQAVRVAKAMIATVLTHPQIHARSAAGHQLFRFSHEGAADFLIDALHEYGERYADFAGEGTQLDHGASQRKQYEDVVANLYAAVRGLGTPRSRTVLLERLFIERRSVWRCCNAISDIFSPELHAEALALLAARRADPAAGRGAGHYAHSLANHVKQVPPLVELGRVIVDWTPPAADAGMLRYALIVAEKAALDTKDYELVRALHAAAARISAPVDLPDNRGRAFVNPLDEEKTAAALAKVLSGAADEAKASLVAASEAARAKGTPQVKISDAQLAELAGAAVASRWMHDPATGEVLFADANGNLRYFDGYAVSDARFTAHTLKLDGMAAHLVLDDASTIDERAIWWSGSQFRDATRIGANVILYSGPNNGMSSRHLLVFPSVTDAAALLSQLRANPAKHYVASDPYYLEGKGALLRIYYVPLPGGGYTSEREGLCVLDEALNDVEQPSHAAAIAEYIATEMRFLRANGTLLTIEYSSRSRRATDMTVAEWLEERARSDKRTPIWHLRALAEFSATLTGQGIAPPSLDIQLGAPATDDDIAALAAERTYPLPESLCALWRVHGRASWKLGDSGMRLLSPREVLARRDAARALGASYLARYTPDQAQAARPLFEHLDVLVETLDGTPITVLADVERADGRVFSHAYEKPENLWWEVSLSWMLATRLVGTLATKLVAASPLLARLMVGQAHNPEERVAYLEKSTTFWEMAVDPATGITSTRFGKIGTPGTTTVVRLEATAALAQLAKKEAEKRKGGYRAAKAATAKKPTATAETKKPAAKAKTKKPAATAKTKKPTAKAKATKPVAKTKATKPTAKAKAKTPAAKAKGKKPPAKTAAKAKAKKPAKKRR